MEPFGVLGSRKKGLQLLSKLTNLSSLCQQKQLSEKQFRTKVTDFISKENSRQEFVPLIGKLIEKAHVEPLHVKNNAWQYFLKGVLKEAISKSKLSGACKKFNDVPKDSPFSRVVTALKLKLNGLLERLSNGMMKLRAMVKICSTALQGRKPGCFVIILCAWSSGLAVTKTQNIRGKQF